MKIKKISLVIPVYNEEKNLPFLLQEIQDVLRQIPYQSEVIIVDDGSMDLSWKVISEYVCKFKNFKGLRLVKNYGQTQALQVGVEKSEGDVVVVIDADGQNDPKSIPGLIAKVEEGYDVVSGWRYKRYDPLLRRILSRFGNLLVRKITKLELHDIGCSLKAYRREIIKEVKILGEMHRIFPVYLAEKGARITEIKVNHRKREKGKSKYGLERVMKLILDLIFYKFSISFLSRPIYVFGGFGFFSILLSILLFIFIIFRKVFLHGIWISPLFFISVTLLTIGVNFILLGLIAELLVRIYYQTRYELPYKIKEELNF